MTDSRDFPAPLPALERLLTEVRDSSAPQAVRAAMTEALMLCETQRTVEAGVHVQLQGALGSLRLSRIEDAMRYIESAVRVLMRR